MPGKSIFTPCASGERIVVRPTWRTYEPGPRRARHRPRSGDGLWHGLPPHDRLCLRALEKLCARGTSSTTSAPAPASSPSRRRSWAQAGSRRATSTLSPSGWPTANVAQNRVADRVRVVQGDWTSLPAGRGGSRRRQHRRRRHHRDGAGCAAARPSRAGALSPLGSSRSALDDVKEALAARRGFLAVEAHGRASGRRSSAAWGRSAVSPRFFVDPDRDPDGTSEGFVAEITGDEAHHALRVLRIAPGDEVVVLDDSGLEYRGRVRKRSTAPRQAAPVLGAGRNVAAGGRGAAFRVTSSRPSQRGQDGPGRPEGDRGGVTRSRRRCSERVVVEYDRPKGRGSPGALAKDRQRGGQTRQDGAGVPGAPRSAPVLRCACGSRGTNCSSSGSGRRRRSRRCLREDGAGRAVGAGWHPVSGPKAAFRPER